mmetsp:Transcript_28905/g.32115  ORF Transcript_28905/g.32115 Transcript_28905/m.32115 type:complete len:519 (+) Transcript_28905:102-1658(+)
MSSKKSRGTRSPRRAGKKSRAPLQGELNTTEALRTTSSKFGCSKNTISINSNSSKAKTQKPRKRESSSTIASSNESSSSTLNLIQDLPEEVLVQVLCMLDANKVIEFAGVCSAWARIAQDEILWKTLCYRRYHSIEQTTISQCETWKQVFYNKTLLENKTWIPAQTKDMKPIKTFYNEFLAITCLDYSGNLLATGAGLQDEAFDLVAGSFFADKTVKVWDMDTGKRLHTLMGHTESITDIKISGNMVASSSFDHCVKLWRLPTAEDYDYDEDDEDDVPSLPSDYEYCVFTLKGHRKTVESVYLDDRKVVSAGGDRKIKIWSVRSGQCRETLGGRHCEDGHRMAILCMDYKTGKISTGSKDHNVKLWDMHKKVVIRTMEGHKHPVLKVRMDDRFIVSGGQKNIKIWDKSSGECIRSIRGHSSVLPPGWISGLQFDENKIITSAFDRTVKIWDFRTGRCLATLKPHKERVTCLKYDKGRLVTGSKDKTVKIWNFGAGGASTSSCPALSEKGSSKNGCSIM